MTSRARQCGLFLAAFALLGCVGRLAMPGFGSPPGGTGPLKPEKTGCKIYDPVEPLEPLPNWPDAIVGAADFHNHQFSNLGFGGRVVWGDSFHEGGIEQALSACGVEGPCIDDDRELAVCELLCKVVSNPSACRAKCRAASCEGSPPHGHYGMVDPVGAALEQGIGHDVGGYPHFRGWPHWNTYTHQQEYYRWLRRGFEGGLRLIVMLAVSNQILCEFLNPDHPCDDMSNVRRQLEAAKALEHLADYEEDCKYDKPPNGWYRIAKTPREAKDIINGGAMAVVLGAEVDTLFNCTKNRSCSVETVKRMTKEYRELGLTHVFPVHLFDNAFGGTAAANDLFNLGGVILNNDLLRVRDCSEEGYEFRFNGMSKTANELIVAITNRFGVPYPRYADYKAHCNDRKLDPVGDAAIRAMMANGMIIDVDHMSTFTRGDVLELLERCNYPGVVSGHSGFTELLHGQEKSEGQLTSKELELLLMRDGLLAPILSQGGTKETRAYPRGKAKEIANDCGDSAKTFAQAYLYAVDASRNYARPNEFVGVGFGSDINGLAGMPAPRFGKFACGGDGKPENDPMVRYPVEVWRGRGKKLDKMRAGTRIFDINYDGFANMGMFPDFVAELKAIGVTDEDLEPLFLSAHAYIRMWEYAESAKSRLACPLP